jgi:hypothetical protein
MLAQVLGQSKDVQAGMFRRGEMFFSRALTSRGHKQEISVEQNTLTVDLRQRERAVTATLHVFLERPEYVSWEHGGLNE